MPYAKRYPKAKEINFLASSKVVSLSYTISDAGITPDSEGRKIVPAGTVYPANNATAIGLVRYDVDVTNGPQPGAVLVDAWVIEARLPVAPTVDAKAAMKGIKFKA